ncbi:MAG: hypothetical protein ABH858_02610, partial [Candidatus Omnitrophota bacterium]
SFGAKMKWVNAMIPFLNARTHGTANMLAAFRDQPVRASMVIAAGKTFRVEQFPHSYNLNSADSDLRIQLQTDQRYQEFIPRASLKTVMGYEMKVAAATDIVQGKIWAYTDKERRKSKRQKDLADIFRLIEAYPELAKDLPESIKKQL